ncbi:MAG: Arsenate reductase [Candidatus Saccharicenans subterraneus]|uniref:Arsenate reductase n=1 Tax=Candidatus Saccharicenans subterraneus TaxID=2508984 RepID=A0A3E2BMZ2_9BACT|nr:MAG: Arsenate reductase [Candidatus Saccharicenans subterraneum]
MEKIRVLFVCDDNSLRSPMAEAWLNHLGQGDFLARSAGFEPGTLNPLAVAVMQEVGLDISGHQTRSVFELYTAGELFAYVITLCDPATAERCPIFPGVTRVANWPFTDPTREEIPETEKRQKVRELRDLIRERVEKFIQMTRPDSQG